MRHFSANLIVQKKRNNNNNKCQLPCELVCAANTLNCMSRNETKRKKKIINLIWLIFLQHFRRRVSVHSYLHWLSNVGSAAKVRERDEKNTTQPTYKKKSSSFITIKWVRIYVWRWSFFRACILALSLSLSNIVVITIIRWKERK